MAEPAAVNIGYHALEITPPLGEELSGYGYFLDRRAQTVRDPLFARAVALSDAEHTAVLVQLDLLCLDAPLVGAVRRWIQSRFGLPPEAVMLHCTHTHSGPAARALGGCGTPSVAFRAGLFRRLLRVIAGALKDLRPVGAVERFTEPGPPGLVFNRAGSGTLESTLRGVVIHRPRRPELLLLGFACHPVTAGRNLAYSADYCGAVVRALELDASRRVIFLNGCCGDINPVDGLSPEDCGEAIAAAARRGLTRAAPCRLGPLRLRARAITVFCRRVGDSPTEADALRCALISARPEAARVAASWWAQMLAREADRAPDPTVELQVFSAGELVVCGVGAEVFARYGLTLRRSAPAHHVLVAGTSNGVLGYLPSPEDVARGGYASTRAAHLYGMPPPRADAGDVWASQAIETLREAIA